MACPRRAAQVIRKAECLQWVESGYSRFRHLLRNLSRPCENALSGNADTVSRRRRRHAGLSKPRNAFCTHPSFRGEFTIPVGGGNSAIHEEVAAGDERTVRA